MLNEAFMQKLPPAQGKLFAALEGKGDVAIELLFRTIFDRDPPKDAQQRLGPYIVKLNRRLVERQLVVRPGRIKRTYSLQQL